MRKLFVISMVVTMFFLLLLMAATSKAGTFTALFKNKAWIIQTPASFPEVLTERDVAKKLPFSSCLNGVLFKKRQGHGFGILVGSELDKDNFYPVGANHGYKDEKGKPVIEYFNYYDYKIPTKVTRAEAEKWAQEHLAGKPEPVETDPVTTTFNPRKIKI